MFVSGVSSGIGRELVRLLIRENHSVWGIARRRELLLDLASEINTGRFLYSVCDVSSEKDVEETIHMMEEKNFLPDVCILNAAVFEEDCAPHFDMKHFSKIMEINVFGVLRWVGKFVEKFVARGSGQFIVVSSVSAFRPDHARVGYPASKAALSMAFRSLRLRYAKDPIIFSTMYLGPVATPMSAHVTRDAKGNIIQKKIFVADANKAARAIYNLIGSNSGWRYYPYWATRVFRVLTLLPDSIFGTLSTYLKK